MSCVCLSTRHRKNPLSSSQDMLMLSLSTDFHHIFHFVTKLLIIMMIRGTASPNVKQQGYRRVSESEWVRAKRAWILVAPEENKLIIFVHPRCGRQIVNHYEIITKKQNVLHVSFNYPVLLLKQQNYGGCNRFSFVMAA